MALTRKFLQAMGIESEKIDEIIAAHTETVNALKEERDTYKADADKLPDVQKNLDKANAKVAEFESDEDVDKWKVKYDALKEEYTAYKSDIQAEKTKQKKSDAYKALLRETGISDKRVDAVLKVTDLSELELDENGNFKDAEAIKNNIKEEWADFIGTESVKGAKTENPPAPAGGAEIHAPSRAAQVAAKRYEMMYGKSAEGAK